MSVQVIFPSILSTSLIQLLLFLLHSVLYAGFFYLLSQKVDFRRKDFVPYSETLRLRKEQAAAEMKRLEESKEAPSLESDVENQVGSIVSEESVESPNLPEPSIGDESPL